MKAAPCILIRSPEELAMGDSRNLRHNTFVSRLVNTGEKNDEAGLSYLWLQREGKRAEEEEEGRNGMPLPTGMKTSGMPNLELIRSPCSVAQEIQRTLSLAHMREAQNNGGGCNFWVQ